MAEYIDRTQAIDAIEVHMYRQDPDERGVYPLEDWQREQNYAYDLAMEILGNLPAADVRPTNPAEWIEDGYQGLPCVCSYCGEPGKRDWRFCPYCGATMKVAQDPAPDPKSTFYDLLYEEGGANTT